MKEQAAAPKPTNSKIVTTKRMKPDAAVKNTSIATNIKKIARKVKKKRKITEDKARGEKAEAKSKKKAAGDGIESAEKKSPRDFVSDLTAYLNEWSSRGSSGSSWKFSKVLQSWALDNCFDEDKISDDLFVKLIPYIQSVQGNAKDRLIALVSESVEMKPGSEVVGLENDEAVLVRRSKKLARMSIINVSIKKS